METVHKTKIVLSGLIKDAIKTATKEEIANAQINN
jgi:hypothetical protein